MRGSISAAGQRAQNLNVQRRHLEQLHCTSTKRAGSQGMQSINIFTGAGASVNAHGIAHNPGQVGHGAVFPILLSNGDIKRCSGGNAELSPCARRLRLMGISRRGPDVVDNEMFSGRRTTGLQDLRAIREKRRRNPKSGCVRATFDVAFHVPAKPRFTPMRKRTRMPVVPLKMPRYVWPNGSSQFFEDGDTGRRLR